MTPGISITKVQPEELETLRSISIRTFREAFASQNSESNMNDYVSKAFSSEAMNGELQNPMVIFYFVKVDGEVIGYTKLNLPGAQTDLNDVDSIEIERIYVDGRQQGKQYGKLLMDKAIQVAKEKNLKYVWLGVWEENKKAIQFYERNGFRYFSDHKFMLGDDLQRDILMKKEI
jgi:ribosomal protein S18 acetylase RimI-like enzyme